MRWSALLAAAAALGCVHAPAAPAADPGRVHVVCRGEAERAFLVGNFNGWGEPKPPLARAADGAFRGDLELGPGVWEVQCELQAAGGASSREPPVNAPRQRDDGFGGKNGIFEVAGTGPR